MKRALRIGITSILTTAILLAILYFGFIQPKIALPKELLKAKTQISVHHNNLLSNRLSIVGIAKLNATSKTMAEENENLINRALETNKNGLERLEKTPVELKLSGAPSDATRFINEELNNELPLLFEQNKAVLQEQKPLLQDLSALNSAIKNVFLYNPIADIKVLDPVEQKDEIVNRSDAAIEGLSTISGNLVALGFLTNDTYKTKGTEDGFKAQLDTTKDHFEKLKDNVENGDLVDASDSIDLLAADFLALRKLGLDLELSIIRSKEMVEILTDETNLILKYDFYQSKIDGF